MMTYAPQRGFALLISIILTSVSLAIGISLLSIAYKELLLATTAKQSAVAFYNADSALECALYYDQKFDTFNMSAAQPGDGVVTCNGRPVLYSTYYPWDTSGAPRRRTFPVTCPSGVGTQAVVEILKYVDGSTKIYASGYSSCSATDPRRVERGVKAKL